jgi:TRAP transporter TAXI family solute receptor
MAGGLAACTTDPPPMDHLVIAGGPSGDIYHAFAAGVAATAADRWSIDARAVITSGTKESLDLVADGRADAAFATIDVADEARSGEPPFDDTLPLVAVAGLYDDYLHIVVLADSPIRTLADLHDRTLATSGSGSAARILTDRLLATNSVPGVVPVTVAAGALADALIGRRADAIASTGGLPDPAIDELVRRVPVRLIPLAAERDKLNQRFSDQYLDRSLPAGMYGLTGEVETVGVRTVLVVRRDLPDRVAYALAELLFVAKPRLVATYGGARGIDPRSAMETYPLTLHPGAATYYRDVKPMA